MTADIGHRTFRRSVVHDLHEASVGEQVVHTSVLGDTHCVLYMARVFKDHKNRVLC